MGLGADSSVNDKGIFLLFVVGGVRGERDLGSVSCMSFVWGSISGA